MLPHAQVHFERQICCVLRIGKQKGNVYGNRPVSIRLGNGSQVYDLQVATDENVFHTHEGV